MSLTQTTCSMLFIKQLSTMTNEFFIIRLHTPLKFPDVFLGRKLFGFDAAFAQKPAKVLIVFNMLI